MTLLQLAWRNVRHQARNYAAFFLSSTFAVWMFFLYGSLLLHPRVDIGRLPENTREILLFIEVVVALFSVFFVSYAHSAFLKARLKELATLSLLGMLPRQLARMVRYENLAIGLGAITAGVVLGLAFLQFFLLAMSRVLRLDQPIAFAISWTAVGVTYLSFLGIFLVIGLLGQWRLRRVPVAEAFRGAVQPKEPPRFAWWKVALCVALLVPAYAMLLTADGANIGDRMLYILLMLMVGTYLLLTQGSVAILRALQGRPEFYTRRTNLLTISQLVYKMRDNARILYMVTILSTISLLAIGLFYSAYTVSAEKAEEFWPVGLRMHGEPGGVTPRRVEAVLREHGVEVTAAGKIPQYREATLVYRREGGSFYREGLSLMPRSAVDAWLEQLGEAPLGPGAGGGLLLSDSPGPLAGQVGQVLSVYLQAKGSGPTAPEPDPQATFRLEAVRPMPPLNEWAVLVLDDAIFDRLSAEEEPEWSYLWQFRRWRESLPASVLLYEEVRANWLDDVPFRHPGPLVATAIAFDSFERSNGFGFFLAAFVATLFFLASGNMLYFKLFTDLYDDRRQFLALFKLGILPGEAQRVISTQTLVLFFVPLALALVNATVALHLFTRIFGISLWQPLTITASGYSLLYLVYFLITRQTYVRALVR